MTTTTDFQTMTLAEATAELVELRATKEVLIEQVVEFGRRATGLRDYARRLEAMLETLKIATPEEVAVWQREESLLPYF